jgi:beta-lactamase regulating signal transducer with metallopeptidase domain
MNDILSLPIIGEAPAYALWVAVSGASVCAIVLAAALVLGRRSAPLGYSILMGGVVGLLAMPALVGVSRSLSPTLLWPRAEPDEEIVRVPVERLPDLFSGAAPDARLADAEYFSGQILGLALAAVWALGVVIGLGRLLWVLWKRRRDIISQPWQPGFWTLELQARLARKVGLPKFPDVRLSPVMPMPMVLGLWRPAIVLPEQAPESWSEPQWEAILLHEAAHIARRDPWAVLLQTGAAVMFWWCPLVYILGRRLNLLRESICDDYALEGPCDRVAYAELLIESAECLLSLKSVPALALLDSARGGLEARVTRLLDKERRPMTKLSLPGKLGAALLVAVCLLATSATAFSGGQTEPQKKIQIKVIVDGKEFDLGDVLSGDRFGAGPKKEAGIAEKDTSPRRPANAKPVTVVIGDDKDVVKRARNVKVVPTFAWRAVTQGDSTEAKPDPRIEELVKQAEAIKPGSGAAIRNALQGAPTSGDKKDQSGQRALAEWLRSAQLDRKVVVSHDATTPDGKKVLVELTVDGKKVLLTLDDGTVLNSLEKDLQKLVNEKVRFAVRETTKQPISSDTKKEKPDSPDAQPKRSRVQTKVVDVNNAPMTSDMEALRRQLERLTAEVQALKQRLDGNRNLDANKK